MLRTEIENKTVSALFDMDNCISNLTDIQNLFCLMNEVLDSEMSGITENKGLAEVFIARLPLIRSMFNVAYFRLQDVLDEAQSTITWAFQLYGICDGSDAVERGCECR